MAVKRLNTEIHFEKILIFVLLFQWVSIAESQAKAADIIHFGKAKQLLRNKIYGGKGVTFYCACPFQKKSIKTKKCDLKTKKYKKRLKRVEWEHIVPAHAFGQSFKEWREYKQFCRKKDGPRKCAAKKNKLFKEMEGNLHNLVPAVGTINALRSNYSFTELTDKAALLCAAGMRMEKRKVSPPKNKRGDIARIYFYMDKKYPGRGIISNKNKKLFAAWDKLDPVDEEECRLQLKKAKLQKDSNQFVQRECAAKGIK